MAVMGFNNKLQATGFQVKKGTDKYIDKEYKFYEDGSLKFVDDGLDERFDRSYKYDALGRTTPGKAGIAARGGTSTDEYKLDQPYTMQYTHDAFGHLTGKTGYYYGSEDNTSYYYNSNNRNPSWGYDADGNITSDADAVYTYDAAGRIVKTNTTDDYFDGDGQLIKRVANAGSTTAPLEAKSYFVRSIALGKVISEADATGKKSKTFVPANGTTLATQILHTSTNPPTEVMTFNHTDASGTGAQQTTASGALNGDTTYNRTGEYTPLGRNINHAGPYTTLSTSVPPEFGAGVSLFPSAEGYRPGRNEFTLEGIPVPESAFRDVINSGLVGGAFGLLAYSVRMSAREVLGYTVDIKDGDMFLRREGIFVNKGDALDFAAQRGIGTIDRWIIPNNWQVISSLATLAGRQTKQPERRKMTDEEIGKLGKELGDFITPKCVEFLSKFFQKLRENFPENVGESSDSFALFELFIETALASNNEHSGFFFRDLSKTTLKGYAGRLKGKPSVILKNEYSNLNTPSNDRMGTLIHELIHLAIKRSGTGAFVHEDMYSLAYATADELGGNRDTKVNKENYSTRLESTFLNYDDFTSAQFSFILKQYCDGK